MNLRATNEYTHLSRISTWNHEFSHKFQITAINGTPPIYWKHIGLKTDHKYMNSTNEAILQNSKD